MWFPATSFLIQKQTLICSFAREQTPPITRMSAADVLWKKLTTKQRQAYRCTDFERFEVLERLNRLSEKLNPVAELTMDTIPTSFIWSNKKLIAKYAHDHFPHELAHHGQLKATKFLWANISPNTRFAYHASNEDRVRATQSLMCSDDQSEASDDFEESEDSDDSDESTLIQET
jgi:hypothetical protein